LAHDNSRNTGDHSRNSTDDSHNCANGICANHLEFPAANGLGSEKSIIRPNQSQSDQPISSAQPITRLHLPERKFHHGNE